MAEEEKITLCDGKYEFYTQNRSLYCRRYGTEWRQFVGDNAVHALFYLLFTLQTEAEEVKTQILNRVEAEPVLISNTTLLDWADRLSQATK